MQSVHENKAIQTWIYLTMGVHFSNYHTRDFFSKYANDLTPANWHFRCPDSQ
jgi:hypothetical protein